MAATTITVTKLAHNTAATMPTTAALNASDGGVIDVKNIADQKLLLVLENSDSSAGTATIKAGGMLQSIDDMAVSIPGSSTVVINVESGYILQRDHTIKITGAATIKVAAIALP